MNNDFSYQQLYAAHRQDLMREAEVGWQLKAAGVDRPGLSMRRLVLKVIGALRAALLIAQGFAG
ncbi:MAG TPA: hypothetical protein VJG32_05890 [Anaerolineae bacterium]|nr:hypothetical protein [Anaerolineae bacterium]